MAVSFRRFLTEWAPLLRGVWTWPAFSLTSYRMVSELARQGLHPKTVVDVGANVGQFAAAAVKIWGSRVHSFEPIPECADRLRRNARRLPGIYVYPMAIGERSGTARLRLNSHSHSSSLLDLAQAHKEAFPEAREIATIDVPVSTLDEQLGAVDLHSPVLLKIDVQGLEDKVLAGGPRLLRRVRWVVLEVSMKPMYDGELGFPELLKRLEEAGFSFLRPVGLLRDPRNQEILQMDALFESCAS